MRHIDITADRLVEALTGTPLPGLCLLDSCDVAGPGSSRLIAGISPIETCTITNDDPLQSLGELERLLAVPGVGAVFTLSYEFGARLNGIAAARDAGEPDIYVALFDGLVLHDYRTGVTSISGSGTSVKSLLEIIEKSGQNSGESEIEGAIRGADVSSNFTKEKYITAVQRIQELIRSGDTYQANLTQQFNIALRPGSSPLQIFQKLRRENPAKFAAYVDRLDSAVVSASPERFLSIDLSGGSIIASPIKGTRPRGGGLSDERMANELLHSEKDRAENTMIVDLMRNDLGRVCEFGSVEVTELCRLEEHPTLFHLVSDVRGRLRPGSSPSDILRATFPCGSITGAPKIRTMQIIDEIEGTPRGLSMGAIGCSVPASLTGGRAILEMNVAIRTMTIRDCHAMFNTGGGIVSDSDPVAEYDESMLKARALMRALGIDEALFSAVGGPVPR